MSLSTEPLSCLIVDDSEAFLASAARLFSAQGFRVVGLAASGDEALALADALIEYVPYPEQLYLQIRNMIRAEQDKAANG